MCEVLWHVTYGIWKYGIAIQNKLIITTIDDVCWLTMVRIFAWVHSLQ